MNLKGKKKIAKTNKHGEFCILNMSTFNHTEYVTNCNNFIFFAKVFKKNADNNNEKGLTKRYRKMGINITQTMNGHQFENKEQQRNIIKEIFDEKECSEETTDNVISKTIFNSKDSIIYSSAQLSILKAASQISINGTLKETLKYIKNNPVKQTTKTPILGELWNLFNQEQNEYNDIVELEIDYSAVNIFAA